jgi:hypothetical protein
LCQELTFAGLRCGNAPEAFVVKGGAYVYGSFLDIDQLFQQQVAKLDHKRRAATLEQIQQVVHEWTIYVPIWQFTVLEGVGPRVEKSGLGMIAGFAFSAPYEDITIRAHSELPTPTLMSSCPTMSSAPALLARACGCEDSFHRDEGFSQFSRQALMA